MTKKLQKLLEGFSSEEQHSIQEAYDFSAEAHAGQLRDNGKPYIIHPLEVALAAKKFGLDLDSIIAALLHDVVEDTDCTQKMIKEKFGQDISNMVSALTKVKHIKYSEKEKQQAETYRKIILATAKDLRIVVIKLLDRQNNMQTIDAFTPERAKRYAEETLNVYAPIAHRLGISQIKTDLEDMAFAVINPKAYDLTKQIVEQKNKESKKKLKKLEKELHKELIDSLQIKDEEEITIMGRTKSLFSLHEKLEGGRSLEEIYDLIGLRVIAEQKNDCYVILGIVHSLWKPVPGRFFDLIANPKLNGYQSLHTTVIDDNGTMFEVQIRTKEMHHVAEYGVASHWHYKESKRNKDNYASEWMQTFNKKEGLLTEPQEIIEAISSENFQEEIYLFTPTGNAKTLPVDSTPVDFAYAVHSEIGNRCVGARVNNRIVPLNYKLQSGDRVEIMTSKDPDHKPNRDWLNFVVTNKAKWRINRAYRNSTINKEAIKGKEIFINILKNEKLPERLVASPILTYLVQELHLGSTDEMYERLSSKRLKEEEVAKAIIQVLADKQGEGRKLKKKSQTQQLSGVIDFSNEKNIVTAFARCCNPLPGDDVIGYVSLGRGVIVHRNNCINLSALPKERLVKINWNSEKSVRQVYAVRIHIRAWDRTNLLQDLTSAISEQGFNLQKVDLTTNDNVVQGEIIIEIDNSDSLPKLLDKMSSLDGIISADRG